MGRSYSVVHKKFTLKERDIETGLDYFKARYYGSLQGRFTSPDPLAASGKPAIPQSWNRYTYVLDNPFKFIDPSGMIWVYHYLDKNHHRAGFSWFDGTEKQISKQLGKDYHAVQFGKSGTATISLTDGGTATLHSNSRNAEVTAAAPQRRTNGDMPSEGMSVMHEVGRRPFEKATGAFALAGAALGTGGGVALSASGAMAGTTTLAIDSFAVTSSGAALDLAVVGSLEETSAYVGKEGFNVLRAAKDAYSWGGVNEPWLDSIIQNGQSVLVKAGGMARPLK